MPRETARRRGGALEVVDHVAQLGGLLELHAPGGVLHLLFEVGDGVARTALQELARLEHARAVVVQADLADARRGAVLDDRREAVFVVVLARLVGTARAQAELVAHQVERRAQGGRVREGAEIPRAVVLAHAGELEARDRVRDVDAHHEVILVVAEGNVVARAELLDESAFEQERFRLGLDDMVLEIPDALDERAGLDVGRAAARGHEITADALAQILGLADVDDAVEPVAHQVDAGFVRHVAQFLVEVGLGLGQRVIHRGRSRPATYYGTGRGESARRLSLHSRFRGPSCAFSAAPCLSGWF